MEKQSFASKITLIFKKALNFFDCIKYKKSKYIKSGILIKSKKINILKATFFNH